MKHIDVAHLWLQDEVKSNRLQVRRVQSGDNLAGTGTKALSDKIVRKRATSMVYVDAIENLKSGDVMEFLGWQTRVSRSGQSRLAENVIEINW